MDLGRPYPDLMRLDLTTQEGDPAMPQAHVHYALIRIRDTERPEAARRAHARRYHRNRPTRPLRIPPIGEQQ